MKSELKHHNASILEVAVLKLKGNVMIQESCLHFCLFILVLFLFLYDHDYCISNLASCLAIVNITLLCIVFHWMFVYSFFIV